MKAGSRTKPEAQSAKLPRVPASRPCHDSTLGLSLPHSDAMLSQSEWPKLAEGVDCFPAYNEDAYVANPLRSAKL
jgi:hypothetical protein